MYVVIQRDTEANKVKVWGPFNTVEEADTYRAENWRIFERKFTNAIVRKVWTPK